VPHSSNPAAAAEAAPPVVAAFISEFVSKVDSQYTILKESSDDPLRISLFDLQMETLIFGLHCLDRAVFTYWGDEYRIAFMNFAFGFACEMFSDALPESQREIFLEGFKKHCDTRQAEYGLMKPIAGEDGAMKNVLPYEFSKRLCIHDGAYNPVVQIVLMEWAEGIMTMMLKIGERL